MRLEIFLDSKFIEDMGSMLRIFTLNFIWQAIICGILN